LAALEALIAASTTSTSAPPAFQPYVPAAQATAPPPALVVWAGPYTSAQFVTKEELDEKLTFLFLIKLVSKQEKAKALYIGGALAPLYQSSSFAQLIPCLFAPLSIKFFRAISHLCLVHSLVIRPPFVNLFLSFSPHL